MSHKTLLVLAGIALACVGAPRATLAHDARPLSIVIVKQTASVYRAVVRIPPTIAPENRPRVVWPMSCAPGEGQATSTAAISAAFIECDPGIENGTIRIEYPYYNPSITTLIRYQSAAGRAITAVLPPDTLTWSVPSEPTFLAVAGDYLVLGFEHIWSGMDHLLFVAGLLLLARRPRKIVWAVTGFTIAHSLTLSLAALGVANPPVALVETMIALSIVFLAAEIARAEPFTFSHRYPVVLAFVFGLLHGFGFAGALGQIDPTRGELVAGLLFFNLGVEIGQLSFIAAVLAVAFAARLALSRLRSRAAVVDSRLALPGAYCLGVPAAFWFVERAAAAFIA